MAYTIQFLDNKPAKFEKVFNELPLRFEKDGRFKAQFQKSETKTSKITLQTIVISKVRLTKNKEYCGNHPGECPISNEPKKKMSFLEWEDWINFNNIINKILNKFKVNANVWSEPQDVKGKFWIRKGKNPRLIYNWTEEYNRFGTPIRIWSNGTDTEFGTNFHHIGK